MLLNLCGKTKELEITKAQSPELEITKAQSIETPILTLIFMWKTGWDLCEGCSHEACDNYNKYEIMIDEYGNIQMAAGGP